MKISQESKILDYLKAGGSLTPLDALNLFGVFRLSGRILSLRQQGHNIITETVHSNGKAYAKYFIPNPKQIEMAI